MTNNHIKYRLILLLLGLILGWVVGGALGVVWFIFNSILLGYGDSGPEWVNTVTTWIQIISVLSCLIASQLLYHYSQKKGKL